MNSLHVLIPSLNRWLDKRCVVVVYGEFGIRRNIVALFDLLNPTQSEDAADDVYQNAHVNRLFACLLNTQVLAVE